MSAPEVVTYGMSSGSSGRASAFDLDGMRVLVSGDDTKKIRALAEELAASRETLAAVDKGTADVRLLGVGCVRFQGSDLWLLNGRERGFAHFGFRLRSWDELFRRWNVRVTEHGADEHGAWWAVESFGGAQ